jgi:hypothetical protein
MPEVAATCIVLESRKQQPMYDATDKRMRSKSFQNVTRAEKVACADLGCVSLKSQSLVAQDELPDVVRDPEADMNRANIVHNSVLSVRSITNPRGNDCMAIMASGRQRT